MKEELEKRIKTLEDCIFRCNCLEENPGEPCEFCSLHKSKLERLKELEDDLYGI